MKIQKSSAPRINRSASEQRLQKCRKNVKVEHSWRFRGLLLFCSSIRNVMDRNKVWIMIQKRKKIEQHVLKSIFRENPSLEKQDKFILAQKSRWHGNFFPSQSPGVKYLRLIGNSESLPKFLASVECTKWEATNSTIRKWIIVEIFAFEAFLRKCDERSWYWVKEKKSWPKMCWDNSGICLDTELYIRAARIGESS